MKRFCLWCCLLSGWTAFSAHGSAGDENWDRRFFARGLDGEVFALVSHSNALYVGGSFRLAGGLAVNGIARWNGSSWQPLGTGVGGAFYADVNAIAVTGSNVYVGGDFSEAGDVPCTNFARWNGKEWSGAGLGWNRYVTAMAASGGDVYVAGGFGFEGEPLTVGVARWNGTNWFPVESSTNGYIRRMFFLNDELYVSGSFDRIGGINATNIAKWNGTAWQLVAVGSDAPAKVWAMTTDGSRLHVAGSFNGKYTIGRWEGSQWISVTNGLDNSDPYGDPIHDLVAVGSDVYVTGAFTRPEVSPVYPAALLNGAARCDGTNWFALAEGLGFELHEAGRAVAALGHDVYVAGLNHRYSLKENFLARWDGAEWTEAGGSSPQGIRGTVRAIAALGRNIYAGGSFDIAGNLPVSNIARWDGTNWHAMGEGLGGFVFAIAVDGNRVLAGGTFGVAEWDGNAWTALPGLAYVNALAVQGTNIYASHIGYFNDAIGKGIMQWTGSNWIGLGGGLSDTFGFELYYPVSAIALQGNDVYITGQFIGVGGVAATNVAKWNGANWSALGNGLGADYFDQVAGGRAMAILEQNIYVSGFFGSDGGWPPSFAQWDGTNWSILDGALGISQMVASDGVLYGTDGYTLNRLNGTNWSMIASGIPPSPGEGESVSSLAVHGSDLFVGGNFTHIGDTASQGFAIWHIPQKLSVMRTGTAMTLFWPTQAVDFVLQSPTGLASGTWSAVPRVPEKAGRFYRVTDEGTNANKIFRLRRPY